MFHFIGSFNPNFAKYTKLQCVAKPGNKVGIGSDNERTCAEFADLMPNCSLRGDAKIVVVLGSGTYHKFGGGE